MIGGKAGDDREVVHVARETLGIAKIREDVEDRARGALRARTRARKEAREVAVVELDRVAHDIDAGNRICLQGVLRGGPEIRCGRCWNVHRPRSVFVVNSN